MVKLTLDRDTILKRINGIQNEVNELEKISKIPFEEFKEGVGFKLAQFHLHRAPKRFGIKSSTSQQQF